MRYMNKIYSIMSYFDFLPNECGNYEASKLLFAATSRALFQLSVHFRPVVLA